MSKTMRATNDVRKTLEAWIAKLAEALEADEPLGEGHVLGLHNDLCALLACLPNETELGEAAERLVRLSINPGIAEDDPAYRQALSMARSLIGSYTAPVVPYAWAVEMLRPVHHAFWEHVYTVGRREHGEVIAKNDPSHTYRFKPLYTHPVFGTEAS